MKTRFHQLLCLSLMILNACHFSSLKDKEPHFKMERQVLTDSIKSLYICDEVHISSMFRVETMTAPDSVLRITLIRNEAPKREDPQLDNLARKIAAFSCNSLQSRLDYNLYEVEYKWLEKKNHYQNTKTVVHSFWENDLPRYSQYKD